MVNSTAATRMLVETKELMVRMTHNRRSGFLPMPVREQFQVEEVAFHTQLQNYFLQNHFLQYPPVFL
jgi:hypothetical protein